MEEDIVETPDGVLHRLACPLLDQVEGELYPAGTLLERARAPQECWICEPRVLLVLSV